MLDNADQRDPRGAEAPTGSRGRQVSVVSPARRHIVDALVAARAIVLVALVPLQVAIWVASCLTERGMSDRFAFVAAVLFGFALGFAGLIVSLKLAIHDRSRVRVADDQSKVEPVAPESILQGDGEIRDGVQPVSRAVDGAPASTQARVGNASHKVLRSEPSGPHRPGGSSDGRSRLLTVGAAAALVGGAYVLAGGAQTMIGCSAWSAGCLTNAATLDRGWIDLTELAFKIAVPALLIEMLWTAFCL